MSETGILRQLTALLRRDACPFVPTIMGDDCSGTVSDSDSEALHIHHPRYLPDGNKVSTSGENLAVGLKN